MNEEKKRRAAELADHHRAHAERIAWAHESVGYKLGVEWLREQVAYLRGQVVHWQGYVAEDDLTLAQIRREYAVGTPSRAFMLRRRRQMRRDDLAEVASLQAALAVYEEALKAAEHA